MEKAHNNLNIENLIKTEWFNQFDICQQEVIRIGLEQNLNASIYAKTELNDKQMSEIRLGLLSNVDVSIYNIPTLDEEVMEQVRIGLEQNIYLSEYLKDFSCLQLVEIRKGLQDNLDVSKYAKSDISSFVMRKIKKNLLKNNKKERN